MNKSEDRAPVLRPQKTVAGDQGFDKPAHAIDEVLLAFPVVVDVYVHIGDAGACHPGECLEELRPVFFLRVEEGVLRRAPVGIGVPPGDLRPVFHPQRHAFGRDLSRKDAASKAPNGRQSPATRGPRAEHAGRSGGCGCTREARVEHCAAERWTRAGALNLEPGLYRIGVKHLYGIE